MSLNSHVKPALRKRLITVVSAFALLSQIVFIGPVRKADAKAKAPVADTSSPAEPFVVQDSTSSVQSLLKPSGLAGALLALASPTTVKKESSKTEEAAIEPPSPAKPMSPPMMATGSAFDLAQLRLSPKNATGGTDLYSRNFGWGTSLVGLPGRAGLDAGFGISYNSLVWIKDTTNSEIIFDPDLSNVSPGFKMGFPTIEAPYQDPNTEAWRFLVVSPGGGRTEFKQDGSSANFYPGDSSYSKLYINDTDALEKSQEEIDITIVSTDGTKMHYLWNSGSYRCYEIKDRNGNYISIDYNGYGRMTSVTDTLGRVLTINYDGGGYPTSITQDWKATNGEGTTTTHTWATFSYTNATVSTSFSGLTVIGPANSTTVKVLEKITYPDSSFTKFEYNGYIQVKKISQVAADSTSHILNYVTTDLASVSGTQTDCPRFGETKTWVENFNGGSEVVVTNSLATSATYSLPNSITGSATRIDVAMTGHPDGLYSRTYVGASGYKEGLPLATEDCTGSNCATRLRWTWTDWTQDNTGVGYITNPRVVESRVGDGTNIKKTTVTYESNGFGLPELVKIYDTDLSTVLKMQQTTYNLSSTYRDRRIIGLPSETKLFDNGDPESAPVSRVTYAYDEGNLTGTDPVQNISPTQHDNTNYSSSFVSGRGLLTTVSRWDVLDDVDPIDTTFKYNTAGALVSKTDPLSHTVKIAYADNFNTTGNPTTYAYPTTITDQAGSTIGDSAHSSTIKYRYDIGANILATSPAPAGQTYGKTSKRVFDSIGRLDRQSIYVNSTEKAYTRYEYPTNGIQSKSYTPIIDADGDTNIAEDEVYSESWFDGAGRVRGSRTEHPGSTGGWTATQTEYNVLGQVYRTSVPTEVSVSSPYDPSTWTAAGDDSTRGWIWNKAYYDWKGRPIRTVPSDSTGSDGKDTLISYAGCGCAGGQVTTVSGPVTTAVDVSGSNQTTKRRTHKSYEDILGRTYKNEVWDLDGAGTYPYSTTKTTFNGRDQATLVRQYEGADSSTTYQDTTMAYDGHGRLTTQHKPEQALGRYTTYTYLADDRVATVTDARGAGTHYDYDVRGLVEEISYSLPGNVEGETPWVDHTDKSGTADLSIKGGGFASDVKVSIWSFDTSWHELQTFTSGALSTGTSGGYQTLGFTVTDSTALYNLNNHISLYLQVENTDTEQKSIRMHLYYNGSSISYGSGKSDAPASAPTLSFEYDDLGNKTEMTDGVGTVEYEYNSLSQITSETRAFTDITSRTFETQYTYELSGLLKTITDPYSAVVSYSYQKNGRLSAVGSTGYNWTNPFISDLNYRAWGSIKQADYGNGSELNMAYDTALRPTQFEVTQSSYTRGTDYTYYADGKMHTAEDLADDHFDKAYKYDHAGRMKEALSGFEARGESNPDSSPIVNRPYKQTYDYDVWDNRTGGDHKFWRTDLSSQVAATYVNNRQVLGVMAGSQNDADGRPAGNKVDASSKPIESITGTVGGYTTYPTTYPVEPALEITQTFDGGRDIGKRQEISRKDETVGENTTVVEETTLTYYLRSEVLGGKTIAEVKPDATKKQGNVYANGALLAEWNNGASMVIEMNPLTGSFYKTDSSANAFRNERDPKGAVMGFEDPWLSVLNPVFKDMLPNEQPFIDGGDPFNPNGGCEKDGMPYSCSRLEQELDNGSATGGVFVNGQYMGQVSFNRMFGSGTLSIYKTSQTDVRMLDDNESAGSDESGDDDTTSGFWTHANFRWNFNSSTQRNVRTNVVKTDVKKQAKDAYDKFKEANKACDELAKKIGLDKAFDGGKFIRPDDKLLDMKLKDLKFDVKNSTSTLRDVSDNYGLTNPKTKTVYLFESTFQGMLPANIIENIGNTTFHETLHLKYGDHFKIADALGLNYDRNAQSEDARATSAESAVNDFVSAGCVK